MVWSASASLAMLKPLIVWITTNCGKFLKRWEYQTTLPVSWETCMQVKKQQLELDMGQWTTSNRHWKMVQNWGRNMSGLYIVILLIYLICKVHHEKCWAGWITDWNKDCWEKYQQPDIRRWYHPNGRKQRITKEPLDESEKRKWKSWLKTQHSKN